MNYCPCILYTVQVTAPCIRQVTAFLTLQTISLILDTVQVTAPVHCMLLPLYCTLCKYCPCKLFKSLPLYCTLCKSLTLYTASHCPCTLCKSLLLYTVQVTAIVLHSVSHCPCITHCKLLPCSSDPLHHFSQDGTKYFLPRVVIPPVYMHALMLCLSRVA